MNDQRERINLGLEKLVREGPFHPNKVSAMGLFFTGLSVATSLSEETRCFAPGLYAGAVACDILDGYLARKYGVQTREGAMLDPFVDKVKNLAVGGLMIAYEYASSPFLVAANLINFAVDGVSQARRGNIVDQTSRCVNAVVNPQNCALDREDNSFIRANVWGKVKASLQNVSHFAYLTYLGFHDQINDYFGGDVKEEVLYGVSATLLVSAVSGAVGIIKRQKK
jgi:phosphatidylglycerophosphate synthase